MKFRIERHWLSNLWNRFADNPYLLFLIAWILVAFLLFLNHRSLISKSEDVLVEVFGFLLDILLFGVILSLYDKWRDKRQMIREYQNQLMDFIYWKGTEAVCRKTGLIKRLNELKGKMPKLNGVHLYHALLPGANLNNTRLYEANLEWALLNDATLDGADLRFANLQNAQLQAAVLRDASLGCANLTSANFSEANLEGVYFSEAIVTHTHFDFANLKGADMSEVKGLTAKQLQHSFFDESTILPSNIRDELELGSEDNVS